jgi:hypothetical protein
MAVTKCDVKWGYEAQRDLEPGLARESSSQGRGPAWIETEAQEIYYFATCGCYKASRTPPSSPHSLHYIDYKEGHWRRYSVNHNRYQRVAFLEMNYCIPEDELPHS